MDVRIAENSGPARRTLRRSIGADSLDVLIDYEGIEILGSFHQQPSSAVVPKSKQPGRSGRDLCGSLKGHAPSAPIVSLAAIAGAKDEVFDGRLMQ
jgi:DNA-binding response OmpR family regulator